jgi:serine/threonine-protein kinase HipA
MSQSEAFGLLPIEAAAEVIGVIEVVNTWQHHFISEGVSAKDITLLVDRIDGEDLILQRQKFSSMQVSSALPKKRGQNPFR